MNNQRHNYEKHAEDYAALDIAGSFYPSFRDIPSLLRNRIEYGLALDYGCGSGRSTRFLEERGFVTIGVDISRSMLDQALERDPFGDYQLIGSGVLPFEDNTFDLVFSSYVLIEVSSLEEIEHILSEWKRVLKDDGVIAIVTSTVKDGNGSWVSFDYSVPDEDLPLQSGDTLRVRVKGTNVVLDDYYWSGDDLKLLFEKQGLNIIEEHHALGKPDEPFAWEDELHTACAVVYLLSKSGSNPDESRSIKLDVAPIPIKVDWQEDEKLLLQSSDYSYEIAQQYCNASATDSNCLWYHGSWQYCRLLRLVPSPDLHREHYRNFLLSWHKPQPISILVSGTADYAIVDHLRAAMEFDKTLEAVIHVADLCRTPLEACRWYANNVLRDSRIEVNLYPCDCTQLPFEDGAFDLITTYSFLSRFNSTLRAKLADEWIRVLRSGGQIITSDRISPEHGYGQIPSLDTSRFISKAERNLRLIDPSLSVPQANLKVLVREYAEKINRMENSIPSLESLQLLFHGLTCSNAYYITSGELEGSTLYASVAFRKEE